MTESLIKSSKRKHRLLRKRRLGVHSFNIDERINKVSNKVAKMKIRWKKNVKETKFGNQVDYKTKWRNLNSLLGRDKQHNRVDYLTDLNSVRIEDPKIISQTLEMMTKQHPISPPKCMTHCICYQPHKQILNPDTCINNTLSVIKI